MREATSALPEIRRVVWISTAHVPEIIATRMTDGPPTEDMIGMSWDDVDQGWLMWVPSDPVDSAASMAVPPEILFVQVWARAIDCDYVRFDADAQVRADLPRWEW